MKSRINGHVYYFDHLTSVKRVAGSRSRWTAERNGVEYQIEGGRHAGGTKREWFVDGPDFNQSINCVSLADALRLLDTM